MKRKMKKLSLERETLRQMESSALQGVLGNAEEDTSRDSGGGNTMCKITCHLVC